MSLSGKVDWQRLSEQLKEFISLDEIHSRVAAFLEKEEGTWAVACSGGVDSLALLLLIYSWFPEKRKGLYILHFNHKLRFEESDEDERFVLECGKALNIQVIVGQAEELLENVSEAALRELRHRFFKKSLDEIGAKVLLLGHQREDIGETMLMRLARGSGTGGLCAPRPLHYHQEGIVYLRPFITLPKERIVNALVSAGIPWREDSTNEATFYFRNRIRHNVLPEWEAASTTDIWKGIVRSRELLEEDEIALLSFLEELYPEGVQVGRLDLKPLKGKPKALYRRLLHQWLIANGCSHSLSAQSFEKLLNAVFYENKFKASAGEGVYIEYKNGELFLEKQVDSKGFKALSIVPGVSVFLPGGGVLEVEVIELRDDMQKKIMQGGVDQAKEAYLDWSSKNDIFVRTWQEGDRYHPLGAPGHKKMQDVFTDKKVDVFMRKVLPVVAMGSINSIAWCPGLPIEDKSKITKDSKYALRLTYFEGVCYK